MEEVFKIKLPDMLSGHIGTTEHGGFSSLVITESLAPCIAHSAITVRLTVTMKM